MKKPGQYKIPFDKDGNLEHFWADYFNMRHHQVTLVDNHVFEDTLTPSGMSRGRSAANFQFKRSDGREVTVFMRDLLDMLPRFDKGVVRGRFSFVKRGNNYGCCLLT